MTLCPAARDEAEAVLAEELARARDRFRRGECTPDEVLSALDRFAEFVESGILPADGPPMQRKRGTPTLWRTRLTQ